MTLCLMLTACGGHGYEGTYESKVESGMIGNMSKMLPKTIITIGDNYIESQGKRIDMDNIFVRNTNGKKYLILEKGNDEQSFEIAKDGSLVQNMGMINIRFIKQD